MLMRSDIISAHYPRLALKYSRKAKKMMEYISTVRSNMTYPLITEQWHGPKLEAWVEC